VLAIDLEADGGAEEYIAESVAEADDAEVTSTKTGVRDSGDRCREASSVGNGVLLLYAHGWRSGRKHLFRLGDQGFKWVLARSRMTVDERVEADRRECDAAGIKWLACHAMDDSARMAHRCSSVVNVHAKRRHDLAVRWYCGITANPFRRWAGFRGHGGAWNPGHSSRPGGPWAMHVVAFSTTVGVVGRAEKMVLEAANHGRPRTQRGWATTTTGWSGNTNVRPGGEGDGFGVGPWYIYVLLNDDETFAAMIRE